MKTKARLNIFIWSITVQTGYSFREESEEEMQDHHFGSHEGDKPSFYIFTKTNASDGREESAFYCFDTVKEALALFQYLEVEHPDWDIHLGIHKDFTRRADIIKRSEGVNVLSDDFKHVFPWKDDPTVTLAAKEAADRLKAPWQVDRELLQTPILIPHEKEVFHLNPFFEGKTLWPDNQKDPFSSVLEVCLEEEGWIPIDVFKEASKNHGSDLANYPRVSSFLVVYEVDRNGFRGSTSLSPSEYKIMEERYRAKQQEKNTQQKEGEIDMKTMKGWDEYVKETKNHFFQDYVKKGDVVGQDVVDYFINLVPPTSLHENLVQMGSPYASKFGPDGKLHPVYGTFLKEDGSWKYCGHCFRGEVEEPFNDVLIETMDRESRPEFDYLTSYGETEKVMLNVDTYREDDNLYVAMEYFDKDLGARDHFADITVNIYPMPLLTAAIDTNNNGEKIVGFLEKNGLAEQTGKYVRSGWCEYPVMKFSLKKLMEADPDRLVQHLKIRGLDGETVDSLKDSLVNGCKSLESLKQEAKERASEKNKEQRKNRDSKPFDLER